MHALDKMDGKHDAKSTIAFFFKTFQKEFVLATQLIESSVDELLRRCRLVFEGSSLLKQLDDRKKDSAQVSSLFGAGACGVLLTCADARFTVLLKAFRFSTSSQLGNGPIIPRYGCQLGSTGVPSSHPSNSFLWLATSFLSVRKK